jgi:hypothetical protein
MVIRTIDIAHPPLASGVAEEVLADELKNVQSSKDLRVLKVIHGYGSKGKAGVLKEVVRNWAYRHRARLLAIIPGEEYTMFDTTTIEMRKSCGQESDPDLGAGNPGMTLLWVK